MNDSPDNELLYSMGGSSLKVPMGLFGVNRRRLCQALRDLNCHCVTNGVVLLIGGENRTLHSTDTEEIFHQESFFHWSFGIVESDCIGVIVVQTGECIVFVPRYPAEWEDFTGYLLQPIDFKRKYQLDKVAYVDELSVVLKSIVTEGNVIMVLSGRNSDSQKLLPPVEFEGMSAFKIDKTILHDVMCKCRMLKTPCELEILRYVANVTSKGHRVVMKKLRCGWKEYQCESVFRHYCLFVGGCRTLSYIPLCSSGKNISNLNYGQAHCPNYKTIRDGDLCLLDMACSYYGYCTDVTCTFPANGKFTDSQALIYNAVLKANRSVIEAIQPGIEWSDLHLLANQCLLTELKDGGLLQGEVIDMMSVSLSNVFQPHGLGHFVGCDFHDVGGYLNEDPERSVLPGLKYLRFNKMLEPDMVVTVGPGCYFIPSLLKKAVDDPNLCKFLVADRLAEFCTLGGVRIEDVVLVTEDGCQVLTDVPRTVDEIEECMKKTECFTELAFELCDQLK